MGYKVGSNGMVTLPEKVRRELGVKPGDKIDYVIERGEVILKPVRGEENPFTKWIGFTNPDRRPVPAGTAVKWVRRLREGR